MNAETATLAAQFLQRVTLQPAEIEAFQTVMQALGAIVKPPEFTEEVSPPASEPEDPSDYQDG